MLDIFGPSTVPLLLAGGLGGLCRGVVARSGWLDVVRAIVVGACCSLFLHGWALEIFGGLISATNPDPGSETGIAGFLAGAVGISLISVAIDYFNTKTKPQDPPAPPPVAPPIGNKP